MTNEIFDKSWKYYVDFALITIMIVLILYYGVEGYFIKKEIHIVEVCQGQPFDFGNEYTRIVFPDSNLYINYTWNET